MSSVTSSTARTSRVVPPPKTDSPSAKTLVRLLISSKGIGKMVTARTSHGFSLIFTVQVLNVASRKISVNPRLELSSAPCNHGHGQQRRNHAQRFPTGEVLPEDKAGEQHGHCGIERAEHDGGIETAGLARTDEQYAADDVETTRKYAKADPTAINFADAVSNENDQASQSERRHFRYRREPERRGVASLLDAEIESREADACERGHSDAFGRTTVFGARDEPDSRCGQYEAYDLLRLRQTFAEHSKYGWNGCAEHRRHRGGQAH